MAIDFRCQGCQRLLRTDDADAGKPAKCPECGQVTTVPAITPPAAEDAGAVAATGAATPAGANPYSSPTTGASPFARDTATAGAGSALDVGDVLSASWRLYMDNFGLCLGISVAIFLLSAVVGAVLALLMFGGMAILANGMGDAGVLLSIVLVTLLALALVAFSVWLGAGQTIVLLKIARGEEALFGDLFSGGRYVLPLLGSSLLVTVMVAAGMLACIVPGVILSLIFYFYLYLIIDRDQGVLESLGASRRLTEGNRLNLFLLLMMALGISMVAGMIPCGIGQVLAQPLIAMMSVVAYLRLSGQATAENRQQVAPAPVPLPAAAPGPATGPAAPAEDSPFGPPPA